MFSRIGNVYNIDNPTYVEANRTGQITEEQKEFLGGKVAGWLGFLRFTKGLYVILILFFINPVISFALIAWGIHPLYAGVFFIIVAAALAGWFLIKFRQHARWKKQLTKELTQASIRSEVGTLNFGANNYHVILPDQQLMLPFIGKEDLEPGIRYRFYYLPESGTILSAESVGPVSKKDAAQGLTEVLAEVNKFKLECLSQNRRGELAPSQYALLYTGLMGNLFVILLLVGVGGYVFLSQGDGELTSWTRTGIVDYIQVLTTPQLITGGIFIVFTLFILIKFMRLFLDLVNRQVDIVEGPGSVDIRQSSDEDGSTSNTYFYIIEGLKFKVKRRAFLAFEPGRTYRAYFTPYGKKLVNLEVLD